MKINVSVNYTVDRFQTVKNGTRSAIINHERRKHALFSNPSIEPKLSKYNSYNTLGNYKQTMDAILKPYIKHHNGLKSVKINSSRKIKSVKQLLNQRGRRIPYKYIVLKFGNGQTRNKLLKIFSNAGYSRQDYSDALNQAFINYAKNYNETHKYLKYDHADTNLDEVHRKGGDHVHLGCIANATTQSGKTSLSFDRATKQEYDGHNGNSKISNISAWHIMQSKEAGSFIHFANQSFQRFIPDLDFQLIRNPDDNNGLMHDKLVQVLTANDKLRQLLSSVLKQNAKLQTEAKGSVTVDDYNHLVTQANRLASKLQAKNIKTSNQLQQAKQANQGLYMKLVDWSHSYNQLSRSYNQLIQLVHGSKLSAGLLEHLANWHEPTLMKFAITYERHLLDTKQSIKPHQKHQIH